MGIRSIIAKATIFLASIAFISAAYSQDQLGIGDLDFAAKAGSVVEKSATVDTGSVTSGGWNCPNARVADNLLDNFCWGCMLPISLLGTPIPSNKNFPSVASTTSIGMCPSALFFGTDLPCIMTGVWEPDKFVEVTRTPWCSTVMGGDQMASEGSKPGSDQSLLKFRLGDSKGKEADKEEPVFYHHHIYSNPIAYLIGTTAECNFGASEVQLMWMSELLSEWEDDELMLQLTPEAGILSNGFVIMSCMADAIKSVAGQPINSLFYCAGSWGTTYPFTGNIPSTRSAIAAQSLALTKAMAFNHRLGMAEQSSGDAASCANIPNPFLVKNQYKFQQFYPRPEKSSNHWIGALTFKWGEWRSVPAVGEDYLITLWRWNDCCVRIP